MRLMIIGNIGFDLMAPYLRANQIESVLVSIVEGDYNCHLADKTHFFHSRLDWQPLVELALSEKVDGVISISGPDQMNLRDGHVKDVLEKDYSIPVLANPLEAVRIAVDKLKTKAWLRRSGFPTTEGCLVKTPAEAKAAAKLFGYPVVLKLLDHSGGVGFRVIESEQALSRVQSGWPYLLEKYVFGLEFSIEVLNFGGQTLPLLPVYKGTTNYEGVHPMERVKLAPAPLDPADIAALRRLAKDIVSRLGLQPTADVDVVWGENGPQVLEINPRFGGVTALSMAASGVPVYWALVDMMLGRWNTSRYRVKRIYAADLPIKPDINPTGVAKLLNTDGVFRVKLQKLKKTAGRVALRAENPDRLLSIARQAARLCGCGNEAFTELQELLANVN